MRPGPIESGGVFLNIHLEGHLFILEEVEEGTFPLKAFLCNCDIVVYLKIKGWELFQKLF